MSSLGSLAYSILPNGKNLIQSCRMLVGFICKLFFKNYFTQRKIYLSFSQFWVNIFLNINRIERFSILRFLSQRIQSSYAKLPNAEKFLPTQPSVAQRIVSLNSLLFLITGKHKMTFLRSLKLQMEIIWGFSWLICCAVQEGPRDAI